MVNPSQLAVQGLSHRYGDRTVLDDVSFEVGRARILGLLGPNGSGKSTALAILAGLLPLETGTITFAGRGLRSIDRAYRAALGVCFQHPSVDVKLTARENVGLSLAMHGIKGPDAKRRVSELLDLVELADRADEPLRQFSGGMRRRVDLVRAIAHGPSLLLLDEPTTGLDEAAFRRIWRYITRLRDDLGLSVIVATHRGDEAAGCDRLVFLDHGRVIANDTPAGLMSRVSSDVVRVRASRAADLVDRIREIANAVSLDGDDIVIHCERGHELVVRLVEAFPAGRLDAVSLQRPSLSDVFLALAGEPLDDRDLRRSVA